MKTSRACFLGAAVLLVSSLGANPVEQPQVILTLGANETVNADWVGVEGRTYFVQCSMDLQSWLFAPFVEYSDGIKSYGMESDSPRLFLRLSYTDDPPVAGNPEAMDFDSDGLPSLFEVSIFGTDPLVADTDGDTTNDGEEFANPTVAPATTLEVFTPLQ